MIKEAYCSYEISKLLKEKGFDEKTTHWYNVKESLIDDYPVSYENFSSPEKVWLAPTLQMACAWLREKGYHIYTFNLDPFWIYEIQSLTKDWTFSFGGFENHDAAIEAALKYSLENLI